MKVKDLLGESFSLPIETNTVIKAMLDKISKDIFYSNHYSQGYEGITSEGIKLGNKINEVFFLQQGTQDEIFGELTNKIVSTTTNNPVNIQASIMFNEVELRRAILEDRDLQEFYDKMLQSLRTTLLIQRRNEFIKVLTKYFNDNDIKVIPTSDLSTSMSVVYQGFKVPSSEYNLTDDIVSSYETDLIALLDYRKLGVLMNEKITPFISWLQYNTIVEDTLPTNVNGSAVNPMALLFDKRLLKILVNDSQFSYLYNPNSLTYTITYTENINIVTNKTMNVALFKEEV